MNKKKIKNLVFGSIGIVLFIWFIKLSYDSLVVISTYQSTSGRLIEFEKEYSTDDKGTEHISYAPVYQFVDKNNVTADLCTEIYSSGTFIYSNTTTIFYKANNLNDAYSTSNLIFLPLVLLFFIILCFVIVFYF